MNVRDIMTTPVQTLAPEAKVGEVARAILDRSISGLPVVDDAGHVLGIVRQTDLVTKHAHPHVPRYVGILGGVFPIETHPRRAEQEMQRILGVTARELMTAEVPTVSPDTDIDDAATTMVEEGIDPLIVMEDGRLVGLLTQEDIIRLLVLEESDDNTASE